MPASNKTGRYGRWRLLAAATVIAAFPALAAAQAKPQTPPPAEVTVVNANAGPCTADFVVTDAAGKPIYNAKIEIQLKYGFLGAHRIDATVGTNVDGKARIEGLPQQIKSTASFDVTSGTLTKSLPYEPQDNCHPSHEVTLGAK